ncbi:MAG TPA: heme ABC transporter ATP-binding protein [Firmicutes bacterium]|nr:heme ABC transporter ATP-binding protein [Bacillota bacterium]
MKYVIEMLNITKEFPGIKANDNITLQVEPGEIHALLGENGAGKSTLMSVLFGLYQPEEGVIKVRGNEVNITDPNIANDLGIGMVHQHFKLVHNFTVTENIVLGNEPKLFGGRINIKKAAKRVAELSEKYNLHVDPYAKIEDISVGMQQRVEILKMLYRNADILIFDEPTAVLTPQEIEHLMRIMKQLTDEGKSIIVITHKLKEIKAVANRCTIIRKGKGIGTVDVATTSEQELADLMVGRQVTFKIDKEEARAGEPILQIENLNVVNARGIQKLKNLSLTVKSGEILGVAGIEGNGQSELIEAITGLNKVQSGAIKLTGEHIEKLSVRKRTEAGIGHIPEDRHKHGLVLDYSLEDNYILQTYYQKPFSNNGILNRKEIRKQSETLIERFDVRSGQGSITPTRSMSGGNQQKAIIAREVVRSPKLLIAAQPTRGLDVGAIEYIHKELIEERDKGRGVLLISLELDEILNVSDRIAVIYEGEIVAILNASETDEKEIGLLMAGAGKKVGVQ